MVTRTQSLFVWHTQTGERIVDLNQERLFVDTAYVIALLNPRDAYHKKAKELLPQLRTAHEVWITEAILIEVGNSLA